MDANARKPGTALAPLALTWLVLVALTVASPYIGGSLGDQQLAQILVAAIIWAKGQLVARHFIEAELAHPFIRHVLRFFVAFAPIAIVLTAFFGEPFARWASL